MVKHKILSREWGYISMDCYGYEAKCSCGEIITGWSQYECEKEIAKHLDNSHSKEVKNDRKI